MRKLKLQVQMTIDGYIGGPNGEMDWAAFNWDEELVKYVGDFTDPIDTILLGRVLAEGFIPHWSAAAADPSNPMAEAGRKFTDTPKVVFSRTLTESKWENTILAKGELSAVINELKQQEGGDIVAYGGARFVNTLISEDLIDEFHLFINPTAIGSGLEIFKTSKGKYPLALEKSTAYSCGIVVNKYVLAK